MGSNGVLGVCGYIITCRYPEMYSKKKKKKVSISTKQ